MSDLVRDDVLSRLWAKTGDGEAWHLLIYHLIDVRQAAMALWEQSFNPALRHRFSAPLGLSEDETGRLLSFWIGLHDLGKACPSFQKKVPRFVPPLREIGLTINKRVECNVPHGFVTHFALAYLDGQLLEHVGTPPELAKYVSRAIAGHHGSWPLPEQMRISSREHGGKVWQEARAILVDEMVSLFQPPCDYDVSFVENIEALNSFLILLSGFTTTADWIGSMSEFFPYEERLLPLDEYAERAAGQATAAIEETGWRQWHSADEPYSFAELFPGFTEPNTMQAQVIAATEGTQPPALAIIEAPTGKGKTEIAYYLADIWTQQGAGQGIYIAMPTQATSNQMFDRTAAFLGARYSDYKLDVRLLHSGGQVPQHTPDRIYGDSSSENPNRTVYRWFQPKKRGLLAPFAVGTVDQVLLSILLTRHYFVRLFGLAGKVVIFDEVHAYDTYMNELFMRLLRWLNRIGASVIILSATLPNRTRQALIEAYTGTHIDSDQHQADYPRLSLFSNGQYGEWHLADDAHAERKIGLNWLREEDLLSLLSERLSEGGCAVVICNTVRRARELYNRIADAWIVDEDELLLFHSRYPFAWRQQIEADVLAKFSKDGERPQRMILVATQVIEQSLDLDFDLMISDLAPVDLLIQRAGRLHRHDHERYHGYPRPASVSRPELFVVRPDIEDGLPIFDRGSEYIYGRFLLLASWHVLRQKTVLSLPTDTTELIETVYGEGWRNLLDAEQLALAFDEMIQKQAAERNEAGIRVVLSPEQENLLIQPNPGLTEDNPAEHARFRAMTRLIEPGITVICLHETINGYALEPDGESILLDQVPDRTTISRILQYTVEVRDRRVIKALLDGETHRLPAAWREEKALAYHVVGIFRRGECPIEGTTFTMLLDRETGLEITQED